MADGTEKTVSKERRRQIRPASWRSDSYGKINMVVTTNYKLRTAIPC